MKFHLLSASFLLLAYFEKCCGRIVFKRSEVLKHLSAVLGRNYHDTAVFLAQQVQQLLFPPPPSQNAIDGLSTPHPLSLFKLYFFAHKSELKEAKQSFLACSSYVDSIAMVTFLRSPMRRIRYHQIYRSPKEGLYCVKIVLHEDLLEAIESQQEFTVKLLIPYSSLLKLDVTIHHLFHYLFQDSLLNLRENQYLAPPEYHPFVQHYLSSKKIGVSILLHPEHCEDKAVKRQILEKWHRTLQQPIKQKGFSLSFERIFSIVQSDGSKQRLQDIKSKKVARLFPVSHYFRQAASISEDTLVQCRLNVREWEVRYHKYGLHLIFPASFHQRILAEHSVDRSYVIACLFRLLVVILQGEEVQKVAFSSPIRTLNDLGRQIVQSGAKNGGEPYTNAGLNGNNVVLGVSDTGIDENSCYFTDLILGKVPRSSELHPYTDHSFRKVIQYVNFSGSGGDYSGGHGSHVAGTLAGYCSIYSSSDNTAKNHYMGMASQAKLAFFDMGVDDQKQDLVLPEDLKYVFHPAYLAGARIHSNSWGGDVFYDSLSLETDEYLYRNPHFMTFFAAGNSGGSGRETVLSPGTSKNGIAVACSETGHSNAQNIGYISSFSSNGPTLDGRIKPDISGPGNTIFSVKAHSEHSDQVTCEVEQKAGTSMATPVVAGNAGLIVQYFQDPNFWASYCNPAYLYCQRGSFNVSGVLLKALVLQSGKAMTAYHGSNKLTNLVTPPDTYQGYGRLDLANILPLTSFAQSNLQLFLEENSLTSLTERRYYISFPSAGGSASSSPLKITASWIDPPNHEFVAQVVLNDLDLILTDPAGNVFYGNTNNENDQPVLGAQRDELNNNEQITIVNPRAGIWTASVQAKALSGSYAQLRYDEEIGDNEDVAVVGNQNYAIVITSATGTFVNATQNQLQPLSMASLQQCPRFDAYVHPKLAVDIALWSRVVSRGWWTNDHYHLQQLSSPDGLNLFSYQGSFNSPYAFTYDSLCLDSGGYSLELVVNSTSQSYRGSQLSVPQCNQLFLTPLAPKISFTILNASYYEDGNFANTSYHLFPWKSEKVCLTSCHTADHVLVSATLVEYAGEGWNGGFFTILEDNPPVNASTGTVPYSISDTLLWDYVETHELCLPSDARCYLVQLSFPEGSEDEPQVLFSYSFDHDQFELADCVYNLNTTISFAKFCVPAVSAAGTIEHATTITFYRQTNSIVDLGMKTTNFNYYEYYQHFAVDEVITPVGECQLRLTYVTVNPQNPSFANETDDSPLPPFDGNSSLPISNNDDIPSDDNDTFPIFQPISIPTPFPTRFPTNSPTINTLTPSLQPVTQVPDTSSLSPSVALTSPPTVSPSAVGEDDYGTNDTLSCMEDCRNFPGLIDFRLINAPSSTVNDSNGLLESLCSFLENIYPLCDSYSISTGICYTKTVSNRNSSLFQCLQDCTIDNYCYLGAALVTSCPDAILWNAYTNESLELRQQCIASVLAMQQTSDTENDTSARSNDRMTVALLIVIIVIVLLILAGFTAYSLCKTFFPHRFSENNRRNTRSSAYYVDDIERDELPPNVRSPSVVINTLHTSHQPPLLGHSDDMSSDGFHSPDRSPRFATDSSQRKAFTASSFRQQIYESSKQLLSGRKKTKYSSSTSDPKRDVRDAKKGMYEMINIEDMNSSHPFKIAESDEEVEEDDDLREEAPDKNSGRTEDAEKTDGKDEEEDHESLLRGQSLQEREEALEFLKDVDDENEREAINHHENDQYQSIASGDLAHTKNPLVGRIQEEDDQFEI